MINEAWTLIEEEGVYRGQCAELCGADHGFMPIVVEAVSPEAFRAWVLERRQGLAVTDSGDARTVLNGSDAQPAPPAVEAGRDQG